MKVYTFTSSNFTNIWAGVGAQTWAVPRSENEGTNKGNATKAANMPLGALGILYCSENKCFTSPFVVHSAVDTDRVVENVWPGKWILPFAIRTLGNPHATLAWDVAKEFLPSCIEGKPLNKLLHVEPLTVFAGDEISAGDWAILVERLAN